MPVGVARARERARFATRLIRYPVVRICHPCQPDLLPIGQTDGIGQRDNGRRRLRTRLRRAAPQCHTRRQPGGCMDRLDVLARRAAQQRRLRRAADRQRRALPRRLRRRALSLAAHAPARGRRSPPGRRSCAARGVPLIDIPPELVPPHYPNAAQAKLLLREGVREPLVRTLTTIAIIEGFGAMIRDQRVPDLSRCVREPLDGTACAHLAGGLFEAHARDEAGHRSEGGHKQMWEAARDLALDNPPVPGDVLMRLMTGRRGAAAQRLLPAARRGVRGAARGDGQRAGDRGVRRRHLPLGRGAARRSGGLGAARGRRRRWSATSAATRRRTSSTCARR